MVVFHHFKFRIKFPGTNKLSPTTPAWFLGHSTTRAQTGRNSVQGEGGSMPRTDEYTQIQISPLRRFGKWSDFQCQVLNCMYSDAALCDHISMPNLL